MAAITANCTCSRADAHSAMSSLWLRNLGFFTYDELIQLGDRSAETVVCFLSVGGVLRVAESHVGNHNVQEQIRFPSVTVACLPWQELRSSFRASWFLSHNKPPQDVAQVPGARSRMG